jgi:hypothetical protein
MLDPRELVRTAFYPKLWATLYTCGRAKVCLGDDRVVCWMLQLEPRVGFRAKKKELDTFKAAIEQYEADPEMNPMTVMQVYARVLSVVVSGVAGVCYARGWHCASLTEYLVVYHRAGA